MKNVLIKVVPNDKPDADGVWVTARGPNRLFWNGTSLKAKYEILQRLLDPLTVHPVDYRWVP